MVEPRFNLLDLILGDGIKVGAFREEAADEAIGVFNGAFFPGMIGLTEIGVDAQLDVEQMMLLVFRAVIVGDRAAHGLGQRF